MANAKLNPVISGDSVALERAECNALGEQLHDTYVNNDPYPHIVIDNLFPHDCLKRVLDEFPERQAGKFADGQSNLKTGYQMEMIESNYINSFQNALNSSQFIEFLEKLSGIQGLIPDPHFFGGGLHETARGGHLSIHADFNMHSRLKARRRMNLILFLNEDWQEEYGGHLELWDQDMQACRQKVLPLISRAVIFNTESDSYHGHPDPCTNPPGTYRRSIATYYYTTPDGSNIERAHTTDFKVRPNSTDKPATKSVRISELIKDFTPPIVSRWLAKPKNH